MLVYEANFKSLVCIGEVMDQNSRKSWKERKHGVLIEGPHIQEGTPLSNMKFNFFQFMTWHHSWA
jgi:hypothetical protein